jgi:hypothetical protein
VAHLEGFHFFQNSEKREEKSILRIFSLPFKKTPGRGGGDIMFKRCFLLVFACHA